MSVLRSVYELTVEMDELFTRIPELERAVLIEKLEKIIEVREDQIEKLIKPTSIEEKQLSDKLLKLDKLVSIKVNSLFQDVKRDIKQVKQQKEPNMSYINPYGNVKTVDGLYLDSKQ